MNRCGIYLLATAVFSCGGAQAAFLDLDSAVREGLLHSPVVQQAQAGADAGYWRKMEALGDGFLPKISANGAHYFKTKYEFTDIVFGGTQLTFPGIYPSTQGSLNATIPIFDGFSSVRKLQAASSDEAAYNDEYARAQFQAAEEIRLAFYQVLAADALETVAEENVKTLEDHMKQVEIQRRGGVATNYDTLRVGVQLSEARSDEDDARDNKVVARKKLSALLGLESDDRELRGSLPAPDARKAQDLEIDGVPGGRDDIHALILHADASDHARGAASAWFVPSVSLGGQMMVYDELLYNNAVIDNHKYSQAYNVGVFLNWNLFDGLVSLSREKQAAAQAEQAERMSDQAKLQIPVDFAQWKRRYISSASHYQAKQLDVQSSEEGVRLAKIGERAGSRTSTEVLDAELDLFRSRAGVVNAQMNAAEALIRLELTLGRKL